MRFDPTEHPHRRLNMLTGEYVLVSPHRARRPWHGQIEKAVPNDRPPHSPECYLCPGNTRTSGAKNPDYTHTFVFTNDFSALLADIPASQGDGGLFQVDTVRGTCRVMCFSPRHDLSLAEMAKEDVRAVVDAWALETEDLGRRYSWVQVFENKGAVMGSSMPHPHGQIWAHDFIPNEARKEDDAQRRYFSENGTVMLVDYVLQEIERKERVVLHNEYWAAVVPFWAVWPFEILLMPRRHVMRLPELESLESDALADILRRLLVRYDNLFETSFPYSMGWHGAPYAGGEWRHWQLHAHFYPPLLRSATVKKFMVGYEMLSEAQRDLTAEQAAERLKSLSDVHFRQKDCS